VYLTCSKKLTDSQFSLPHQIKQDETSTVKSFSLVKEEYREFFHTNIPVIPYRKSLAPPPHLPVFSISPCLWFWGARMITGHSPSATDLAGAVN